MRHIPVLTAELIKLLQLKAGDKAIDCTLGDAGHAAEILDATAPDGELLGIDADPEAVLRAKNFLHRYDGRTVFVRDNFERLSDIVADVKFGPVQGILIDLGWSTPQFEERGRGFSFAKSDEPLDMRYDMRMACPHSAEPPQAVDGKQLYGKCTAAELLNTKSEDELVKIFKELGEEKLSKEIASRIVEKRDPYPLETVSDLVEIVLEAYREKLGTKKDVPWVGGLHPATKVFQALRIAVNDELGVLERVLPQAVDILAPGGRLAVISFHSLEDRIVKHFFKARDGKDLKIITKKPVTAHEEELTSNPRSRSAKLRVAEKYVSLSRTQDHGSDSTSDA